MQSGAPSGYGRVALRYRGFLDLFLAKIMVREKTDQMVITGLFWRVQAW